MADTTEIDDLIDSFELLDDWEDRYAYIIDLGRKHTGVPADEMIEDNKVEGCMSQVWLTTTVEEGQPPILHFRGDSDAAIVKGLVAILMMVYSGKTPQAILDIDIEDLFARLGLDSHLSSGRRNSFFSMVQTIRRTAESRLSAAS